MALYSKSVQYGSRPDQVADVTFPAEPAGSVPLVMFWHGGFWRAEHDRFHVEALVTDLAERGYAVANVEYRRVGGGGGWPATLTDVAMAADAVPDLVEGERPGLVDRDRVVYAGHSAGGHLATWAALRHRVPEGGPGRALSAPRVAGVLALAPVLNLVETHGLGGGSGAVHAFLGGAPDEVPDRYAAADPSLLGSPSAPLIVVHGDRDASVPIDLSRRYVTTYGGELVELPDCAHFELIDPGSAAWPFILEALTRLTAAP